MFNINITLHYDKPWCKIYFHEDIPCIRQVWIGFATSQEFRDACDFSLQLLTEKPTTMMIADNTLSKVIEPKDQQWLNEIWFPQAYRVGYRVFAVIVAKDIYRNIAIKKIVNNVDKGKFTLQFFEDLNSAIDWLKTTNFMENLEDDDTQK